MMLSPEYVRSILEYDPDTGLLRWKQREDACVQWNARWVGKAAGTLQRDGYISIGIHGRRYMAHRLAYLIVSGVWPADQIDHIDLDKTNNRWKNLRVASSSQNRQNLPRLRSNTSGFKGVCYHRGCGKWQSQIRKGNKRTYLGLFDTAAAAHEAYVMAATKLHGKFARVA